MLQPDLLVRDLMKSVQVNDHVQPAQQLLQHNQKKLNPGNRLIDCGIGDGSFVFLGSPLGRGGRTPPSSPNRELRSQDPLAPPRKMYTHVLNGATKEQRNAPPKSKRMKSGSRKASIPTPNPEPVQSWDLNVLRSSATRDTAAANVICGMAVTMALGRTGVFDGTVTSSRALDANLEGYFVHLVVFGDPISTTREFTYAEVLSMHNRHLQEHLTSDPPINLGSPPTQTCLDTSTIPRIQIPAGNGESEPISLPIPVGLCNYPVRLSQEGVVLSGKICKRAVSASGLHLWCVKHDNSESITWIDNDDLFYLVNRAKRLHKLTPPVKKMHALSLAPRGFTPDSAQGWVFEHAATIGRAAAIHLDKPLEANQEHSGRRRNNRKPVFTVILEAVLPNLQGNPTEFWGRLQQDPSQAVHFTSKQVVADAIHAHEVQRAGNSRSRNRTFPRTTEAGTILDTLETCVGDFADFSASSEDWVSSLDVFDSLTSGNPLQAFGLGFVLDGRTVPATAVPSLRRALARVTALVEDKHPLGFRLLEYFAPMVQAPAVSEDNYGLVIKKRAALILAGDWGTLLDGLVRRSANFKSAPPLMGDELDTKASLAQYGLTHDASVSKASRALGAPINPPTPSPGVLTASLQKLHPQVGDLAPTPPQPPWTKGQGGGDREPTTTPWLEWRSRMAKLDMAAATRRARAHLNVLDTTPSDSPISFTVEEVIKRVRRGDNGSAGGPGGLGYRTLKLWFSKNDFLSESLTRIINMIAAGDVSTEAQELLNASRGIGIPKDDEGNLRPIAVGHLLLRLIGSMALNSLSSQVQDFFQPAQFGVGTPNGCELMIHAISARLKLHPGDICISCDVKNAFNSFDRNKIWSSLHKHFPSLEPFVRLAYWDTSSVLFAEPGDEATEIKSSVGSRQGCSLGSFLYALAIHEDLLSLRQMFPACHITAYADDLSIVGPPSQAIQAYRQWSYMYGVSLQGELRDDKGAAFSRNLNATALQALGLPTDVKVSQDGIKVLGAPIGSTQFATIFIEKKLSELELHLDIVGRMTLHHAQHALVTKSLQHRISFLFRCVPCGDRGTFETFANRYDKALRSIPMRICHHLDLSSTAIQLIHLPPYLGGLGYRRWMDVADAAFLASYCFARYWVPKFFPSLQPAFPDARYPDFASIETSAYQDRAREAAAAYLRIQHMGGISVSDRLCITDKDNKKERSLHHIQRDLTEVGDTYRASLLELSLRSSSQPRDQQRLAYHLSARADSLSFSAIPFDSDTKLSNRTLQVAMSLRLLEPILPFSENLPSTLRLQCPCCLSYGAGPQGDGAKQFLASKKDVDHWGYHAYRCYVAGNPARTSAHHDKIALIWFRLLRHAGFIVKYEPRSQVLNSEKRPDVMIEHNSGKKEHLDVRTCDPLLRGSGTPVFTRCSETPGTAADLGANFKNKSWKEIVELQGDTFIPLCHETPGFIGDAALHLLGRAAARFSSSNPQRNAFKTFWLTRLHVANIRGVAETIQQHMPFYADDPFSQRYTEEFHSHPSPFAEFFNQVPCASRPVSRNMRATFSESPGIVEGATPQIVFERECENDV